MSPIDIIAQEIRTGHGHRAAGTIAEDILTVLDAAGFVLVPKMPTRKMEIAADHAFANGEPTWNALLAAGAVKP